MPRKSSILKLPKEVREYIASIREEGFTLDEMIDALGNEYNVEVSRSSLHRYTKHVDRITSKIRNSRYMAESIAQHFGDKPTSQVARTNIELLHTIIMDILVHADDEDGEGKEKLKSGDAMKVAIALEKLTKAHSIDTDREMKIQKEAEKEAMKKASKIVENAAREKGLSADMVDELKRKFLGVPNG